MSNKIIEDAPFTKTQRFTNEEVCNLYIHPFFSRAVCFRKEIICKIKHH